MPIDYKSSGVDVNAGYDAVRLMKEDVESTKDENVISGLANFGGMYALGGLGINDPVLVAGTDGVGTKLKLAFELERCDTVGIDCVAMCVNDIVCHGAKPIIFLDYIATGKLMPHQAAEIVKGVAGGCKQAGCSLLGGETAEMPGFYAKDEFDLAGFAVGVVERSKLIDGSAVKEGDALIGLASSGLHSNGFSLVRKLFEIEKKALNKGFEGIPNIGEELLKPTRIYVRSILGLLESCVINGIAHITGGGFIENIPRIIPEGLGVRIKKGSWEMPEIFKLIKRLSGLEDGSLFNTFNMGIGLVCAVPENEAESFILRAEKFGETAYNIGSVTKDSGVSFI